MSKFKVGDEIIIVAEHRYNITGFGSIGKIISKEHSFDGYLVEFTLMTGNTVETKNSWYIDGETMELLEIYNSPLYQALKEDE